ncbi:transporter substrate-binding domain-containing protein [Kiloniella litopenaei]|uniref:transporter substrate-binding domain-containing protein n=1 Tax=Kiloniella litopenaei TaxID=1549748 RepID=UPI003BADAE1D
MKTIFKSIFFLGFLFLSACQTTGQVEKRENSKLLSKIIDRGYLRCGVSQGIPGLSIKKGNNWIGLDVDSCRAISAGIFGNTESVRFIPLSVKDRFVSLMAGEVDLLARNVTFTDYRRDRLGLRSGGVNFRDGVGFLISKKLPYHVTNLEHLDKINKKMQLCVYDLKENHYSALKDYLSPYSKKLNYVKIKENSLLIDRLNSQDCDIVGGGRGVMSYIRAELDSPSSFRVLDDIVVSEDLSLITRKGDINWQRFVRSTLNVLLLAERHGIAASNIEHADAEELNKIAELLEDPKYVLQTPQTRKHWPLDVVSNVGNYSNIYLRSFGPQTRIHLERGPNALVEHGGTMQPMLLNVVE